MSWSNKQGLSLQKELQNLLISTKITLFFARINLVKGPYV